MPYYYPAPDFAAEDISATGNITTTTGTVSAEQLTSTDDANVADQLKLTETPGAHTATPTLAFGDLDTGLWESADDTLNFGSEGVAVLQINTGDQVVLLETPGNHVATPTLAFGDGDTGLYELGDDVLYVSTAGIARLITGADTMVLNSSFSIASTSSPSALSGDQTDWAPSGVSTMVWLRVDPGAAGRVINSLNAAVSGRFILMCNISATQTLTLLHDDGATGTAAQRFLCPNNASVVIPPNGSRLVAYDSTSTRWRVFGAVA